MPSTLVQKKVCAHCRDDTNMLLEQGNYAEAERSYVLAKDTDNVIRMNLEHLGNPEKVCAGCCAAY